MECDILRTEVFDAFRDHAGNGATAISVSHRLEGLQGGHVLAELVARGPPEPGSTWGGYFIAALRNATRQEHSAAFVAFERMGGYWRLLELLSDVRIVDGFARKAFYDQFDDPELHVALLAALTAGGPSELSIHCCVRNLARSPRLRQHLTPAVPILVSHLLEDRLVQVSAAALCNVACHRDAKNEAVECGAVQHLVLELRRAELPSESAEDIVACIGVLTAGCEKGIAALFAVAATQGPELTFLPLLDCLQSNREPPLQCLAIDVVGGLCAASAQCKAWVVHQSPLVRTTLPQLLRSDVTRVCMAALQFAGMLIEAPGFTDVFQRAGGVSALQAILEKESNQTGEGPGLMERDFSPGPHARREPTHRDLAQCLLSKILII